MNDADDCQCFLCQFRRSLAEPMPVEEPEALTMPMSDDTVYEAAELAYQRAQTIGLLTDALVKLDNMNARDQAAGVRRALDELLPQAPTTSSGETAPNTEAPPQTEPSDFYGIPKEIGELAKAMSAKLGVPVDVVRFPRS